MQNKLDVHVHGNLPSSSTSSSSGVLDGGVLKCCVILFFKNMSHVHVATLYLCPVSILGKKINQFPTATFLQAPQAAAVGVKMGESRVFAVSIIFKKHVACSCCYIIPMSCLDFKKVACHYNLFTSVLSLGLCGTCQI